MNGIQRLKVKFLTALRGRHNKPTDERSLLYNYLESVYGELPPFRDGAINVTLIINEYGRPFSSIFIRLFSPLFTEENKKRIGVNILDSSSIISIPNETDICIVARNSIPDINGAKQLVNRVNEIDAKLMIDIDDAFQHLGPEMKDASDAVEYLLAHSNYVTVSTNILLDYAKLHNQSCSLMINTNDARLWRLRTEQQPTSKVKHFVYMGTKTHDDDFSVVLEPLIRLQGKYPGSFDLTLIGVTDRALDGYHWIKKMSPPAIIYPEFAKWFSEACTFDVGLAPLEDSEFNRYKSDIKCIDYIAAGIKPIASNVPAYQFDEGLAKYYTLVNNSSDEWYSVLEKEIINPEPNNSNAALSYVRSNRDVEACGDRLFDTIKDLMSE